jgi:hypothetical protein
MLIKLSAPAGTGNSWAFTLMVDGSPTDLTLTFNDDSTTQLQTTTEIGTVIADKSIDIKIVTGGTPPAATICEISMVFTPTTANETQFLYCSGSNVGGATYYVGPIYNYTDTTILRNQFVAPCSGHFTKMSGSLTTAPGSGNTRTFTINIAGIDDATLALYFDGDGGSPTLATDTGNVAVSAGQLVTVSCASTGTPASSYLMYGLTFVPDTAGDFILAMNPIAYNCNTSGEQFSRINGGYNVAWNATVGNVTNIAPAVFKLKNMQVYMNGLPGVGKTYAFALNQGGSDNANLKVTIDNSLATGATAYTVSVAALDELATSCTATGTPTGRVALISYTGTMVSGFKVGGVSVTKVGGVAVTAVGGVALV